MRNFLIGLFCACLLAIPARAATLPEPVSAALKRAHIPLSGVAVLVQEVHAKFPVISVNAKQAMNPASTMKLLTTFAALETLGPAYRWKTEAYLDGRLENGVLDGDLVFKGYGDPKLTVEQFWMWLRELRQRGLREIRGDIVLDHSFFSAVRSDPAEFDHDPTRAYNVGTDALLLNFNALHLHLIPRGQHVIALLEPPLSGYTLKNNITVSEKLNCHGEDSYKVRLDGRDIILEGSLPAICGETDYYFSILPHNEYFFAVFSALWKELGGTLQGMLREGIAPANQMPFASYVSPPLSEVVRDINKFSNNIMARQLFLTLGAQAAKDATPVQLAGNSWNPEALPDTGARDESSPSPEVTIPAEKLEKDIAQAEVTIPVTPALPDEQPSANIESSTAAVQQWLKSHQLKFPELVLENGAGLSRKEHISANHLAELLQRATDSPFAAELEASLPILGMDGTVKKRFKDSNIAGYAHLKTGSLEGVKALAGYVKARSGKQWIVVFIVNHPNAALAVPAQDALVEWVQTRH